MNNPAPYACSDGYRFADGMPVKSGKTDGKTQHGNRAFVVKAGAISSTIKPAGLRVWTEGVKAFVCRGGHDVEYEFTIDPTHAHRVQHQELPPPPPEPATEAATPARTEQHAGADLSLIELLALLANKTESRLDEIDAELRELDAKRKALTNEREKLRHLAGGVA